MEGNRVGSAEKRQPAVHQHGVSIQVEPSQNFVSSCRTRNTSFCLDSGSETQDVLSINVLRIIRFSTASCAARCNRHVRPVDKRPQNAHMVWQSESRHTWKTTKNRTMKKNIGCGNQYTMSCLGQREEETHDDGNSSRRATRGSCTSFPTLTSIPILNPPLHPPLLLPPTAPPPRPPCLHSTHKMAKKKKNKRKGVRDFAVVTVADVPSRGRQLRTRRGTWIRIVIDGLQ